MEQLIAKMKTLELLDVKLDSFNAKGCDNTQDEPVMNPQDIVFVNGKLQSFIEDNNYNRSSWKWFRDFNAIGNAFFETIVEKTQHYTPLDD